MKTNRHDVVSGCMNMPGGKMVGHLVWLITGIGALHLGLVGLGFDVWSTSFVQANLSALVKPIHYVIGLSGIVSLGMLFMTWGSGCEKGSN